MKCHGPWRRIISTEPSVDPESITMSCQRRYSCAWRAGRVSRNVQPSLKDRIMMLAKGSLMVLANRSRVCAGGSLKDIGCFPTLFQVFTHFRLAASRRYADHGMVERSAMKGTKQTFHAEY